MEAIRCRSCEDLSLVFVYGSNESGINGAGAALHAERIHCAEQGVGFGPFDSFTFDDGRNSVVGSFAIPTKDWGIRTLPLSRISFYVERFIAYARHRKDLKFDVTRIGCGLAGYADKDIAPMFKGAPDNCLLPDGWRDYAKSNS